MNKNKIIVEICCNSAEDVFKASQAGADRVELNSGILLGGLTPSLGSVIRAARANIPIFAMLRPREGGFCYSDLEFDSMLFDAKAFIDAGASGIVFGILNSDGTIDEKRCKQLMEAAGDVPCVFHRAIDVTPDWRKALDAIGGLGIKRVLTSGQAKTAVEGAPVIKEMIAYAAGRVEILPGGGIRAHNAINLIETTGATQLHVSLGKWEKDESAAANPAIRFCGELPNNELNYRASDKDSICAFIKVTHDFSIQHFSQ